MTTTGNISRRTLLGGGVSSLFNILSRADARKLNVLFIASDDMRPELGCYGNRLVRTPNLDAVAQRGLTFTRAYCQQAVCSPSRTSLLTGRRPDTTLVYELVTHFRRNLPDVVTLPEHFKNQGYSTTSFGKIFHGSENRARGLDDDRSWSIASWRTVGPAWGSAENEVAAKEHLERLRSDGWHWDSTGGKTVVPGTKGNSWEAPDVPDNALADGKIADAAIASLDRLAPGPFFLAVGFTKPHLPFVAPKRYYDLYRETAIPLADNPYAPKGTPLVALTNSVELRFYDDIPHEGPVPDTKARELLHGYYAAISYVDAQVGRLVGELRRRQLLENTIIVFWGDHGWHLGEHAIWGKSTNFEVATRAPLIVSAPGQKSAGAHTGRFVEFVDIYPTLCDLCGLPLPGGLEGVSFRPLLENPQRPWKTAVFSQFPHAVPGVGQATGHSIRTAEYRLNEWTIPKRDFFATELYDHRTDDEENVNIAADPQYAEVMRGLARRLHQGWRGEVPAAR